MADQDYETKLDDIIERISQAVDAHDEELLRKAYLEILEVGIESDFWREVFSEGEDWDIRIAAEVKRKRLDENGKTSLSISDLCLIQNLDLFQELLQGDVNMDTVEQCLEVLEEDGVTEKIQLINQKLQQTSDEH